MLVIVFVCVKNVTACLPWGQGGGRIVDPQNMDLAVGGGKGPERAELTGVCKIRRHAKKTEGDPLVRVFFFPGGFTLRADSILQTAGHPPSRWSGGR